MQHTCTTSGHKAGRCNSLSLNSLCGISLNATSQFPSQFPLWDFFECNIFFNSLCGISLNATHDYDFFECKPIPLWDFFECNLRSQFPLWDFFECNRCRFGCLSGNWRGKSAGSSAYPAPATALIKIRTLFKDLGAFTDPVIPTS
jgi:hypothetical protein